MLKKLIISIVMLTMSNVGYSMISKKEWVSLCKNAEGERRYTCEILRQKAGVVPSAFSGNWGKTYDKISVPEFFYLDLGWLQISDISPLAGLTNIAELILEVNHISDLTPLSDLSNLTVLNLKNNQISDLSPLAGLTNLKELYLSNNQISDLTPLAGLTKLTELNILDNQISDFSSVAHVNRVYGEYTQSVQSSPFYTKLLEETSDKEEYYTKFGALTRLVEDVHQMKFLYTFVMNEYRFGNLDVSDRNLYIVKGLENTAKTTKCDLSFKIFRLILDKAKEDKIIDRGTEISLDRQAERTNTKNDPEFLDLFATVKSNTARIEGLEVNVETLQENIEQINTSLNKVKQGLKRKIAIETGVGVIGALLNAVSFGVAGSALQGLMNASLEEVVDFGDITHLQSIAQNNNLGDSFNTGLGAFEATTANSKLEKAIKNKDAMTVITAIAVAIPTDSPDGFSSSTSSVPLVVASAPESVVSKLDAGLSDDESDDESDDGLSDDEEETVFDFIKDSDLEALRNHVEDFSTAEQLKEAFKAEVKERGVNSLKYAISSKNEDAVKIIGEKAVSLGLISAKKLKKYLKDATEV